MHTGDTESLTTVAPFITKSKRNSAKERADSEKKSLSFLPRAGSQHFKVQNTRTTTPNFIVFSLANINVLQRSITFITTMDYMAD